MPVVQRNTMMMEFVQGKLTMVMVQSTTMVVKNNLMMAIVQSIPMMEIVQSIPVVAKGFREADDGEIMMVHGLDVRGGVFKRKPKMSRIIMVARMMMAMMERMRMVMMARMIAQWT